MFKINVGSMDRIVRVALGLLLLAAGLFWPYVQSFGMAASVGVVVVGLVLAATGALRFCPAYRVLGLSTCGAERAEEP